MGKIWTINEQADEIVKLYNEGKHYNEAKEMVSEITKGYCTDQSNSNHRDKLTDIIAPGENIDNGSIYSEATGEIKRDLI